MSLDRKTADWFLFLGLVELVDNKAALLAVCAKRHDAVNMRMLLGPTVLFPFFFVLDKTHHGEDANELARQSHQSKRQYLPEPVGVGKTNNTQRAWMENQWFHPPWSSFCFIH